MEPIILKTNIDNEQKFQIVKNKFNTIHQILEWTLDQEDIDNVLRIVVSENSIEPNIIEILASINILSEELT